MSDMIDPTVGGDPAGRPVGHEGTRVDISERGAFAVNGFLALLVTLVLLAVSIAAFIGGVGSETPGLALLAVLLFVLAMLGFTSLTIVNPGETKVLQFFGRYVGTLRRTGLLFTVPLTSKRKVSVRVQNFETAELKVNDADGNPVNIAGIIVWQVADTAKAIFAVENYQGFIAIQAEAALRHVTTEHPYDQPAPGETSLRGSTDQVAGEIAHEVAARVALAGLEIVETRISTLAYAPEIAQAMLQRQQASAIIAAREKIVEGAVGMVDDAIKRLEAQHVVQLDDERRAVMVSNLLVVLCGDSRATPVVNTGSLYQ